MTDLYIETDDGVHGPFEDRKSVLDELQEMFDVEVTHLQVTPDFLVAQYDFDVPFYRLDEDVQLDVLKDAVYYNVPVIRMAKDAVLAEREVCKSIDGDPFGPTDNDPTYSDRHSEALAQWERERVNREAFAAIDCEGVVDTAYRHTLDTIEDEIRTLWDDGYGVEEVADDEDDDEDEDGDEINGLGDLLG